MILILEDKKITSFMRKFDLFEDFKFIGKEINVKPNEFLKEWIETEHYLLVAQIHPDYQDSFISDGKKFINLKRYCQYLIEPNFD